MSFFTFLEKKGNFGVFEEFFGEFGHCDDYILDGGKTCCFIQIIKITNVKNENINNMFNVNSG